MRRRKASMEDLSRAMVAALRFGNLRGARDGWARLCDLQRHTFSKSRFRVDERDILATIAWSCRGDSVDNFYFQREWFDGELWICCVQSRRRSRALDAGVEPQPEGDRRHEEASSVADGESHVDVDDDVDGLLSTVKAESQPRSVGDFHIGLVAHGPRPGAPYPMLPVAKRPAPCPHAPMLPVAKRPCPTLRPMAVKSEFSRPSGLAPSTTETLRPSTARPSPSTSGVRPGAARLSRSAQSPLDPAPPLKAVNTGAFISRLPPNPYVDLAQPIQSMPNPYVDLPPTDEPAGVAVAGSISGETRCPGDARARPKRPGVWRPPPAKRQQVSHHVASFRQPTLDEVTGSLTFATPADATAYCEAQRRARMSSSCGHSSSSTF